MNCLDQLCALGQPVGRAHNDLILPSDLAVLSPLLMRRNAFYAFDRALHVFGVGLEREHDLVYWNRTSTWKVDYDDLVGAGLFFAEDAFGFQFVLGDKGVESFDPETGERASVAADLEGWAARVMREPNFLVGSSVASEWSIKNGMIPDGRRLVPATPFVLGGEFEPSQLRAVDALEAMRFRAHLAKQLRDVPDGGQIELRAID